MVTIAPIVLFVYNRPVHLKKTIESLSKNTLASESELFVFSDGARNKKDEKLVKEVREILVNETGIFKRTEFIYHKENYGLRRSIIEGVTSILNNYNKVIVLEDDLISSTNFLTYMNGALDLYSGLSNIYSVSGYNIPIEIPKSYPYNIYLSYRPSSWGWGTWKDKWEKVNWTENDYKDFIEDNDVQERFNRGGNDLSDLLKLKIKGKIHSWAIDWAYYHFVNNAFCVYPRVSKINNIGLDRSGTNIKMKTNKFATKLDNATNDIIFYKDLPLNEEIINNYYQFLKLDFIHKLYNNILKII